MLFYRFVEILNALDDSCVIALDGNWGSGKNIFRKASKDDHGCA